MERLTLSQYADRILRGSTFKVGTFALPVSVVDGLTGFPDGRPRGNASRYIDVRFVVEERSGRRVRVAYELPMNDEIAAVDEAEAAPAA